MMRSATLVADTRDIVGESPRWDKLRQRVVWIDMDRPVVHTYEPATGTVSSYALPQPACSIECAGDRGFIVVFADAVELFDENFRHVLTVTPLPPLLFDAHYNDTACDELGALLLGSGSETIHGLGLVRRLERGKLTTMGSGLGLPNGLLSNTRSSVVVADSTARQIVRTDSTGSSTLLHDTRHFEGLPDGFDVDLHGRLWVAFWGGSVVRCLSRASDSGDVVLLPTPQVTSCTFGGDRLTDLYITTAAFERESDPDAGGLFVTQLNTAGRARRAASPSLSL